MKEIIVIIPRSIILCLIKINDPELYNINQSKYEIRVENN